MIYKNRKFRWNNRIVFATEGARVRKSKFVIYINKRKIQWLLNIFVRRYIINSDYGYLCRDQFFCSEVRKEDCQWFDLFRQSCPQTCGTCVCHDMMNCDGMSPFICEIFPMIKNACATSCGLCNAPLGKVQFCSLDNALNK